MTDFVEGKLSSNLNDCSYQPGLKSAPLHSLLPKIIGSRLRTGFKEFGKKMKGYYTEQANVIGVESRTSSPVSIPRNDTLNIHKLKGYILVAKEVVMLVELSLQLWMENDVLKLP